MEIRVNDDIGRRQLRAGQVMIGDEDLDAICGRFLHARDARYAVVNGHDQRGRLFRRNADDLRRQTIAIVESIRHEVGDVGKTERPQATQHQCGARCTVDIEVADNQDALVTFIE